MPTSAKTVISEHELPIKNIFLEFAALRMPISWMATGLNPCQRPMNGKSLILLVFNDVTGLAFGINESNGLLTASVSVCSSLFHARDTGVMFTAKHVMSLTLLLFSSLTGGSLNMMQPRPIRSLESSVAITMVISELVYLGTSKPSYLMAAVTDLSDSDVNIVLVSHRVTRNGNLTTFYGSDAVVAAPRKTNAHVCIRLEDS